MSIKIRFVGGPVDGRSLEISAQSPPPLYFVPLAPSIADLMASSLEPAPTEKAEYEPQLEEGRPSRADDGSYLYRHRVAPLTPEERAALAEGRREASAAEERRQAKMDAAWREVRKERPDFPEDWRDAF